MKKLIPILIVLIFFCCKNDQSKVNDTKLHAQKEVENKNIDLVKKLLIEGDKNNIAYLDKICDTDYKYYFPSNAAPLNLEEHKKFWISVNHAFPDLTHRIQEIYAIDEVVVARLIVSGTHLNEFAGIPPTNKTVQISQIFICRIKGNKIVEFREEADLLGLYQQLGMELKVKD